MHGNLKHAPSALYVQDPQHNSTVTPWSDDAVERLIALWNEGQSSNQIAAALSRELQTAFTRNTVIGKIARLRARGIELRSQPGTRPSSPVGSVGMKLNRLRRRKAPTPMSKLPDEAPPPNGGIGFSLLRTGVCHRPLWPDDCRAPRVEDQRYCGAVTAPGSSWCAGCSRKVFAA